MAFVSVTRLRLRSRGYLLPFVYRTWLIVGQARRADGFVEGQLARGGDSSLWRQFLPERDAAYWTLTVWEDEEAMRAFRNSDPHRRTMSKVLDWCDETSFVHWEQGRPELPDLAEARRRMVEDGRLGRVAHPSASHAEGEIPLGPELRDGLHLEPVSSDADGHGPRSG